LPDLLKKDGASKLLFPTCRKCSKSTSKSGNYTNMVLSGIYDPEEFDKKYGMMCADHAGEVTRIIMNEKFLSQRDFRKAYQKAQKALEHDLALIGEE
jgi:hypothetical protein